MVWYQCRVNDSSGIVGKRAELNENTILKNIGANTKTNSNSV
jgi:hypothetical protein